MPIIFRDFSNKIGIKIKLIVKCLIYKYFLDYLTILTIFYLTLMFKSFNILYNIFFVTSKESDPKTNIINFLCYTTLKTF